MAQNESKSPPRSSHSQRNTDRLEAEGVDHSHQAKKLTVEEIEKLGHRLCTPKKATKELPALVKKVTLSPENETKSVERLYTQAIASRNHNHEALVNKVMAKAPKAESKKMDQQEMAGMVDRLHERSMSERTATMNRLVVKFVGEEKHSKLSPDQQESICSRLYAVSRTKTTETKAALYEKYVLDREPKVKAVSKAELSATVDRLSKKAA